MMFCTPSLSWRRTGNDHLHLSQCHLLSFTSVPFCNSPPSRRPWLAVPWDLSFGTAIACHSFPPSLLTGPQANTERVALSVSNQRVRLVLTPSSPHGSPPRDCPHTPQRCEWPATGRAAHEGDWPYVAWPIFLASLSVSWSPAEGSWFAQGCPPPSRAHVGLARWQQSPCPLGRQNQAP